MDLLDKTSNWYLFKLQKRRYTLYQIIMKNIKKKKFLKILHVRHKKQKQGCVTKVLKLFKY